MHKLNVNVTIFEVNSEAGNMLELKQLDLRQLEILGELSVRSVNVCSNGGLENLYDILVYFSKNLSFKEFRNCGAKSDQELRELCLKYGGKLNSGVEHTVTADSSDWVVAFETVRSDDSKWRHLSDMSRTLHSSLRIRSKNAIYTLIDSVVFDLDKFVELAIQNHCDFGKLSNVGSGSVQELNKFRVDIIRLVLGLNSQEFNKIDQLISSLSMALGIYLEGEDELRASLENRELNLIQFFDQFVLNSEMISARDRDIVIHILQKKGSKSDTAILEQIGKHHSVTRERVRQIALTFEKGFNNRFQFVCDLFDYSYDLSINTQLPLWKITHQPNNSNYSFEWIENSKSTLANLLSFLGKNVFYTLSPSAQLKVIQGGYDLKTYQRYRNLRVYCTVSTQLIDEWTLKSIIEHVYELIVDRVHKDYVYTFQEFKLSVDQLNVVKTIVAQNFELPEEETGVLLARNTIVTTPEVIEEILMETDELMNAEQIHKEYLNRFPSTEKFLSSIQGALNNDRFIYFSGDGVSRYGLKEWETEKGLKAGSIKNMCLEFIQSKDEPVHIHELWKHVAQHRNTTLRSILTNLKLDNKNQFRLFDGSFIGSTSKEYTTEQIERLKQIGPQHSGIICTFIKEQRYYNYDKLIRKFATELGLKSIQIVYIIETKSSEGTFKVKDDKVYYNNSNEDLIIEKICEDLSVGTVSGFNPYRVNVGDKRLLCRVQIISEAKFSVERERIEFDNSAISLSDFLGLLVYHKSSKTCLAFISKSKGGFEPIVRKQYLMSEESGFNYEHISDELLIYRFPIDLMSSFALAMQYSFVHNTSDEDDLSIYNIKGLNKLDSYCHIIDKTAQVKGQTISLLEAKEIYTRLKIRQNV